jgi:hypothetical protein
MTDKASKIPAPTLTADDREALRESLQRTVDRVLGEARMQLALPVATSSTATSNSDFRNAKLRTG